jgi:hypothetical protein
MVKRTLLSFCSTAALILGGTPAFGDAIELAPVDRDLRAQDLANLAAAIGIRFKIFDYETAEPHCVHFIVDEIDGAGGKTRHDGGGICDLAGPQQLTIQWKVEEAGSLTFRYIRYRRDIEQGTSVARPTLEIPNSWFSVYGIEPPQLEYDQEAILLHVAYGKNEGPQLKIKVLAELRQNPDSVIGTER